MLRDTLPKGNIDALHPFVGKKRARMTEVPARVRSFFGNNSNMLVGRGTGKCSRPLDWRSLLEATMSFDLAEYRHRAAGARLRAAQMQNERAKFVMLRIAEDYERLATEHRAKRQAPPQQSQEASGGET
jgi:hypothetical protein